MVEAQEQVPEVKITSLRFTSDKAHCIAANTRGFDVIRMADGVTVKSCTKFPHGLQFAITLGRTSHFLVVGTGEGTEELRQALYIWDDAKQCKAGVITFSHEIVDVRTETERWVVVQLAGQPDLLVFDFAKGFSKEAAKLPLPTAMVHESDKFKDFKHASEN